MAKRYNRDRNRAVDGRSERRPDRRWDRRVRPAPQTPVKTVSGKPVEPDRAPDRPPLPKPEHEPLPAVAQREDRGYPVRKIWQYWEGPVPRHIATCLKSVERGCVEAGVEYQLVSPAELPPLPGLHPNWTRLDSPVLRSDAVRAALMHSYGGLYVDADTVRLGDVDSVFARLRIDGDAVDLGYLVWSDAPTRALNGYIYCEPGTQFTSGWLSGVNSKLKSLRQRRWDWAELGEKVITPLALACKHAVRLPLATFLPLDIDAKDADGEPGMHQFFTRRDFRELLRPETVFFGLNNSMMCRLYPAVMRGDLSGGTMYEELVKHAEALV